MDSFRDDGGQVRTSPCNMTNLINELIEQGWLKTPRIIEGFQKIKREDFLPADSKHLANSNEALPIGYGQTISQPLTVAFMLELLQPNAGDKILDIGSGSGWTSSLLAYMVSGGELNEKLKMKNEKSEGKVIALEIVPELSAFGQNNAAKYNFVKKGIAEFILADGLKGYEKETSYDKILVSACLQKNDIPTAWKEQLKINGRLVCPIGNSIWLFIKKSEGEFEKFEYPGFVFVPLV